MAFKHITSRDNPIFKYQKKLADSARERRAEGKTLLDGVHLIESYCQAFAGTDQAEPELMIIPEGKSSLEATQLMQHLEHVSTIMLPTLMFAELTPVANSTGILAVITIPKSWPQIAPPAEVTFALMLEDIQDPGNLGSMLRTALGAGVQAVYLSKGCTDAWSPKALRGGQGAQFYVPIIEGVEMVSALQNFSGNTFAATMRGQSLYAQDLTQPCAFIIGNEGVGLSAKTLQAASQQISIPMRKNLESLNAAAAAAVCLFERSRQVADN
ncbi:MAG: RNA methyltransferase [Bdellovibrio sp.]|nr:RNA methyltransferase [Methylotenera sp.]